MNALPWPSTTRSVVDGAGPSGHVLGVHALVWAGGWTHEEARRAITSSREAGYQLIEIPALDPSLIDIEDTRAVLLDQGMQAGCSLGLSFDADINNEDPDVVERGLALLTNALSVVAGVGGTYLGGVIYCALGKYPGPPTEKARDNAVASIRTLAQRAADVGVTLGLEVVNRYESNLLNTATQAMAFIDDVAEPNVLVHLDTYHMNIEENGYAEPVRVCGDRLGYVHIGESNRGYLGTGTIDFPSFFDALVTAGYAGPITFESFSSAVVHPDLSRTLCVWRNLWDDGMDLAVHAREYLEREIAAARSRASSN